MSLTYKQLEDLREVLAVVKAFHPEIKRKTLLMMNVDLYDPDVQKILAELDLPVADKSNNYSETKFYFREFEEGVYKECQILTDLSRDPNKNIYACWRICDLFSPLIMNIYCHTIKKNRFLKKRFENFNEFYDTCIIWMFECIECCYGFTITNFLPLYIKYRIMDLFYNNKNFKTNVWNMIYKVINVNKDYIQKYGSDAPISYLCEKTGYSETRVKKYLMVANLKMCSWNDNTAVAEEEKQDIYDELILKKDIKKAVDGIKNETKKTIILNAFGFAENPMNVTEMMKEFGLSYKQYKLLYDQALNQLRITLDGYSDY